MRHRTVIVAAVLAACAGADGGGRSGTTLASADSATTPTTGPTSTTTPPGPTTPAADPLITPTPAVLRLAVIGDYGSNSADEAAVAAGVAALLPDAVVTTGDNVYDTTDGHDERIGQYYHAFLWPYAGSYGSGSAAGVNQFWPCVGNHDWDATIEDWYTYFTLPGNERYYSVDLGVDAATGAPLATFYCVSSDGREPDGNTATSVQAAWLQQALAASTATWQIVAFHHPAFSSALHGSAPRSQWPFAAWGADLVLSGHDHVYERTLRDGLVYVTEGRGGASSYALRDRLPLSQAATDQTYGMTELAFQEDGALLLTAWTTDGVIADRVRLLPNRPLMADTALLRLGATWRYLAASDALGDSWTAVDFDDGGWSEGAAQLGFGEADEVTTLDASGNAWFLRARFVVADPALVPALGIVAFVDDGASISLNGHEIARFNLPAGALTAATLASNAIDAGAELVPVTVGIPADRLVPGSNVIAVRLHQGAGVPRDLGFDLSVRGQSGVPLVREGANWSWRADAPPADWQASTDPAGWATGPGPLGYGHPDLGTVIDGGDPLQLRPATWFRTTFELADPADFDALWLSATRDDSVVLWLNGVELTRANLPMAPLAPGAYAPDEVEAGWAATRSDTFAPTTALVQGTNVLAAEVRQALPAGATLRFEALLSGARAP